MNITEQAIEPHILSNMTGAAQEGATLVGVSVDDPPLKIVTAINAFVSNPSKPFFGRVDNWTDRALPIGSLWGAQLVREFGWEWSAVTFHDHNDSKAVVEVFWGNRWWPATILRRDGARTFIHYDGWGSASDEWVTAERLRPRR